MHISRRNKTFMGIFIALYIHMSNFGFSQKIFTYSLIILSVITAVGETTTTAANKRKAALAKAKAACGFKDLQEEMGPVRGDSLMTKNMGWCFAHTSADLVGYKLGRQLQEPLSSALMSLLYVHKYQQDPFFDGGVVAETLSLALAPLPERATWKEKIDRGFCPQSIEDDVFVKGIASDMHTKLLNLMNLKRLYDQGQTQPKKMTEFEDVLSFYKVKGSVLGLLDQQKLKRAFKISNEQSFFVTVADLVCGERRDYNTDGITAVYQYADERWGNGRADKTVFTEIDNQLNKNNIIGINYNSALLYPNLDPELNDRKHSSTIIGRRWKDQSCQYLVRNSWGSSCHTIDPKTNLTVPFYSKYVKECVAGNLWIRQKDLQPHVDSINYLLNADEAGTTQ